MSDEREKGYYWVKHNLREWEVAGWCRGCWDLLGCEDLYQDSDFVKINEKRIIRDV